MPGTSVPAAFFLHFDQAYHRGRAAVDKHLEFFRATGMDIVKSQILISEGRELADPDIGITSQDSIQLIGHAIQCRITSEDPTNNFTPDYGRITHYRSSGGPGLRLDGGSTTTGAIITPFYDSLLVKVSAYARRFQDAALRMQRALQEFRIRGVKTNLPFLENVIAHPTFLAGGCTTTFIDETPELFFLPRRQDRATKLLTYIAEVIVNGPLEAAAKLPPGRSIPW